jgi:DNA-binding MarR family transcriptional regulator
MADEAPGSPDDASVTRVLLSVRLFTDAMDRLHSGMKNDMDMNATDLAALRMLIIREQLGQQVTPHQLADHLRISTASTTKLLDRLSASGHVTRSPHPTDRRARVVSLTQKSRQDFFLHFSRSIATMREVAGRYSSAELGVISDFLDALAAAIDPGGASRGPGEAAG